jgi:hypothetical protein
MKIVTFNAPAETITDKPMFRDALGRPEITPHNWISEQSRAGMPDKGLGIAGIGLEHLQTAVAGHVGDLDQVGAALHRGGHEASPQAVAGKGCGLEPELGGGGLDDGRDVARREAPIRDTLRVLVEDTPEDSALGDPGSLQPRSQRRDRACNLAAGDSHLAADAFLVRLRAPDCDQEAFGRLLEVIDVERHKLGAPEGTREAKQDDGAVTQRAKRRPRCAHGNDHVRGGGANFPTSLLPANEVHPIGHSVRPDHYRNARLVPLRGGSLTLGSFFELNLSKK